MKILEASATIIKQNPPYGFIRAQDYEYSNYRKFYMHSQVKELIR